MLKRFQMLLLVLFSVQFLSLGAFAKYSFPPSKSEVLNQRLQGCLDRLGCKIVGSVSICRSRSDQPDQSPTSCHLQCRAIDLFRVSCTKTGSDNNQKNLMSLARCLSGPGYLTCYNGFGGCHAKHEDHLHFGADEGNNCRFKAEKSPARQSGEFLKSPVNLFLDQE